MTRKIPRLPSEADILAFLQASPGPAGKRELARAFGLTGALKLELKQMLKDMERRGVLNRARKQLSTAGAPPAIALIEVAGTDKDGDVFGYAVEWDQDREHPVLLRSVSAGSAARAPRAGERVLARIEATPQDDHYRYAAKMLKTLESQSGRVLGVFRTFKGGARIVSIDKKARHDLQVSIGGTGNAEDGELVSAHVMRSSSRGLPQARVVERLGDVSDPRNVSLIAIHQHGIPNAFPDNVLAEARALKKFTFEGREDLRSAPLITIDPADARDHDDAVMAESDLDPKNPGGHIITVAIADVAAYVRPGSALDREARIRGNSTYFPDRVVPMLPERISNDLCSLREEEDRPALCVRMVIDAHGNKRSHRFSRIVMRSVAKLSYQEAQAAIDGKPKATAKKLVEPVLKPLWAAYQSLLKARHVRSPLELDLPERRVVLDATGNVASIAIPERLDAHKLIEEFMILANVAAAEELEQRKSPLLYRVHEEPAKEKIKALAEFLRSIGKDFAQGQVLQTKHFNRLLKQVEGEEFKHGVHEMVLRTQAQAIYASRNAGHFGLALRRYAHFTSPIRRYADLIVHRALIAALRLGNDGLTPADAALLDETAEMISAAERRSMLAERETIDRLVAAYLAGQQNAVFEGRISGVVSAGLFVKLTDTGADGFVPVATLGRDYFEHDAARHALVGRTSRELYQLGDPVKVRLVEIAPVKGGLKLEVESEGRVDKIAKIARQNRKLKKARHVKVRLT